MNLPRPTAWDTGQGLSGGSLTQLPATFPYEGFSPRHRKRSPSSTHRATGTWGVTTVLTGTRDDQGPPGPVCG
jgi:hypothetical protein